MTNRFTKTSWFVQGGIMGVPFDGTPKVTVSGLRGCSIPWPLVLQPHHHISYFVQMVIGGAKLDMNHWLHLKENNEDH